MIPRATYRLQLQPGFGFDEATEIVSFLADLGVSHVYCSPYLQAAPGSTHGYDVVDHSTVNAELGGPNAHARFCAAIRTHGMGQVIDVVPNHMSIATHQNVWWWDVLQNGPASRFADYFDVDWHPPEERLGNKVLLPILGDHYGRVVETDAVTLSREGGKILVRVYDRVLPTDPVSLADPLNIAAARAQSDDLGFIADSYATLAMPGRFDVMGQLRRARNIGVLMRQLERLCGENLAVAEAIDAVLAEISADPVALDEVLERQNYRLAFWRTARHDLDYRRFFDVNELAALRMANERVFHETHELLLGWVADGTVDGLRVDHPDGLGDPEGYFKRLRSEAPEAWIVAEKILEPGEHLPEEWPIHGTTGYDFLFYLNGLFVDRAADHALSTLYAEFVGDDGPFEFHELVRQKKRQILIELLASDVSRVANIFKGVCERHPHYRDYSRDELREVILEVVTEFPVYRTYIKAGQPVTARDAEIVRETVKLARERRADLDPDLFDFLGQILLTEFAGTLEAELIQRFQQLTSPVMAKGLEDTAFYGYHRLASLNEVGGDPAHFGTTPDEFFDYCAYLQRHWPHTMTTTSTHDTKRSEDARVRISLLSEIPDLWRETLHQWADHNQRHRRGEWPDRATEYLLYQTLIGAWPLDEHRLLTYMEKAIREAKIFTSWTRQNPAYETAVREFSAAVIADKEFVGALESFVAPLIPPARVHSLAQVLVKFIAPGVPDLYQGNELWLYCLTDPDNRQPVDFAVRRQLLRSTWDKSPEEILAGMDVGLPKLWLTHVCLRVREKWPEVFGAEGEFAPMRAEGPEAERVIAFARGGRVIAVAPRLVMGLVDGWQGTALAIPEGPWRNALTGEIVEGGGAVELESLLRRFPVSLLVKYDGGLPAHSPANGAPA